MAFNLSSRAVGSCLSGARFDLLCLSWAAVWAKPVAGSETTVRCNLGQARHCSRRWIDTSSAGPNPTIAAAICWVCDKRHKAGPGRPSVAARPEGVWPRRCRPPLNHSELTACAGTLFPQNVWRRRGGMSEIDQDWAEARVEAKARRHRTMAILAKRSVPCYDNILLSQSETDGLPRSEEEIALRSIALMAVAARNQIPDHQSYLDWIR